MNRSQFRQALILGAFLLTLSACNSQPTPEGVAPIDQQCIGSFHAYAYTVPEKGNALQETTLPPSPWLIEASLPASLKKDSHDTVAATRSVGDYIEVWINRESTNGLSDTTLREFLIYRTDIQEWKIVSAQVEDTEVFVDRLYVANDDSIWGGNAWDFDNATGFRTDLASAPVLSKYNEQTERFEFVQGIQMMPSVWERSDHFPIFSKILLDSKGVFWIFAHADGIYSYDPSTQVIEHQAKTPDLQFRRVALAPDGSIYFLKRWESVQFALQNDELFHFFPETGEIEPLEIPRERWPAFGNMLVDHTGRLWLDTVGWRELDGIWHRMYPNPSQYFRKMEVEADYRWATPNVILESSNGYIWYRAEKGMAWFDPQTEVGCWFTTENTNIVEDQENTLWMEANKKLYRFTMIP